MKTAKLGHHRLPPDVNPRPVEGKGSVDVTMAFPYTATMNTRIVSFWLVVIAGHPISSVSASTAPDEVSDEITGADWGSSGRHTSGAPCQKKQCR